MCIIQGYCKMAYESICLTPTVQQDCYTTWGEGEEKLLSQKSINAQFHFYPLQETQHPLVLLQQYFSICHNIV